MIWVTQCSGKCNKRTTHIITRARHNGVMVRLESNCLFCHHETEKEVSKTRFDLMVTKVSNV